jgi:hypothetical protein
VVVRHHIKQSKETQQSLAKTAAVLRAAWRRRFSHVFFLGHKCAERFLQDHYSSMPERARRQPCAEILLNKYDFEHE